MDQADNYGAKQTDPSDYLDLSEEKPYCDSSDKKPRDSNSIEKPWFLFGEMPSDLAEETLREIFEPNPSDPCG